MKLELSTKDLKTAFSLKSKLRKKNVIKILNSFKLTSHCINCKYYKIAG